jgi:hypothetical protein
MKHPKKNQNKKNHLSLKKLKKAPLERDDFDF